LGWLDCYTCPKKQKVFKLPLKTFKQMRARIFAWLAFAIILSSIAYAGSCTDSDGGPIDPAKPTKVIGIKGSVDYGTGPKPDYCVSRLGGTMVTESNWVRENYCDEDNIATKDYLCGSYSYLSCQNGTCINYTGTQATLDDVGTAPNKTAISKELCGNKKLDGLETCDPPHKVCMADGGKMGTCSDECICETAQQKNQTAANQTTQASTNDTSSTSQAGNDTNSIGQLTFEVNSSSAAEESTGAEENKDKNTGSTASTPTGALPADIQDIMDSTDKEIDDLSKRPGIKITSTITNFVMKIWSVISGLFGG
jgi:hypothetical protein